MDFRFLLRTSAGISLVIGVLACSDLQLEDPDTTIEGWNQSEGAGFSSAVVSSATEIINPEESSSSSLSSSSPVLLSSSYESQPSSPVPLSSSSLPPSSSPVPLSSSSLPPSSSAMALNGASLWLPSVHSAQVQVPCVVANAPEDDTNMDGTTNIFDCAGWWYGFGTSGSTFFPNSGSPPALILADPTTGDFISGGNLSSQGLLVKLTALGASPTDPSWAGIAYRQRIPIADADISEYGGFCVTYTLTGSNMELKLEWDTKLKGFDMWYAVLPASAVPVTRAFQWDVSATSLTQSGNFRRDNWDVSHALKIESAVKENQTILFQLLNRSTSEQTADFTLIALGKYSDCQ